MSIKHVIIEGFGFAPVGFIVTEGFGALTEGVARDRGDAGGWREPRVRRYLDRLEREDREKVEEILDEAVEKIAAEESGEEATPQIVAKAAQVVIDELAQRNIALDMLGINIAGALAQQAAVEGLIRDWLRSQDDLTAYMAALREKRRLEDEAVAILLLMG